MISSCDGVCRAVLMTLNHQIKEMQERQQNIACKNLGQNK